MTATTTKERPLIFTAESVNAIRASVKTQTRRIVKPQPTERQGHPGVWVRRCGHSTWNLNERRRDVLDRKTKALISSEEYCMPVDEWLLESSPFAVGQRLWVKEAVWRDSRDADSIIFDATPEWGKYSDATEPRRLAGFGDEWISREESARNLQASKFWKRKSPLYMPRWASRLTLEITGVRAERVADISREDAMAEGISEYLEDVATEEEKDVWRNRTTIENFAARWDAINGKKRGCDWTSNPFVWAIAFRVADEGGAQ